MHWKLPRSVISYLISCPIFCLLCLSSEIQGWSMWQHPEVEATQSQLGRLSSENHQSWWWGVSHYHRGSSLPTVSLWHTHTHTHTHTHLSSPYLHSWHTLREYHTHTHTHTHTHSAQNNTIALGTFFHKEHWKGCWWWKTFLTKPNIKQA